MLGAATARRISTRRNTSTKLRTQSSSRLNLARTGAGATSTKPSRNRKPITLEPKQPELPMATWPVLSALDARTQSFPTLTDAQINRLRSGSKLRYVRKGELLFEPGDSNIPFFVLLSGAMDIVQPTITGEREI